MKYNELTENEKQVFRDMVISVIGDGMYCMRVWSAWSSKTMSENDFYNLAEDNDYVEEKAEELYNFCTLYNRTANLKELI